MSCDADAQLVLKCLFTSISFRGRRAIMTRKVDQTDLFLMCIRVH